MLPFLFVNKARAAPTENKEKVCISEDRSKCNGSGANLIKKPEELKNPFPLGTNIEFYIPYQQEILIDLDYFPGAGLSFTAPQDQQFTIKVVSPEVSRWSISWLSFENTIIDCNFLAADTITFKNSKLIYHENCYIKADEKILSDTDELFCPYLESKEIGLKISNSNITFITKIVAKTLTLNKDSKITTPYTIKQMGDILILINGDYERRFMLLGYDKSRKTTLKMDLKVTTISSIFTNYECAFQDVILTSTEPVTFKKESWNGIETFTLSCNSLIAENFNGVINFADGIGDTVTLNGEGLFRINSLPDLVTKIVEHGANTAQCELLSPLGHALTVELDNVDSTFYAREVNAQLTVTNGITKIPEKIGSAGSISAKAFEDQGKVTIALPETPLADYILKSTDGKSLKNIDVYLNVETAAIGSYMIYKFEQTPKIHVLGKESRKQTKHTMDGQYFKITTITNFADLTIEKIKNLDVEMDYVELPLKADITAWTNIFAPDQKIDTVYFTTDASAAPRQIHNLASNINNYILSPDVKFVVTDPNAPKVNSVSICDRESKDFSFIKAATVTINNHDIVKLGLTEFNFNEVTSKVVVRNAQQVYFAEDIKQKYSVEIDILQNTFVDGFYNTAKELKFTKTEPTPPGIQIPRLELSQDLVGTWDFKYPVNFVTRARIVDIKGKLSGSALFTTAENGIVKVEGSEDLHLIENPNAYFVSPNLTITNNMRVRSLALSEWTLLTDKSYLTTDRLTFASTRTKFSIEADFHNFPMIRSRIYRTQKEEYVNKLLGINTYNELISIHLNKTSGEDVFDSVSEIPFICFDNGFTCHLFSRYVFNSEENSNYVLTCSYNGRKDEACLSLSKGFNKDEKDYDYQTTETYASIILISAALLYILYFLYYGLHNTCVTYCNLYDCCVEKPECNVICLCLKSEKKIDLCKRCPCILDCVFYQWYMIYDRCERCADRQYECFKKCLCCSCCNTADADKCCFDCSRCCLFDENKSIDESLRDIGVVTAEFSIELNQKKKYFAKTINNTRYRSLLYSKLKREIVRVNNSIKNNQVDINPDWEKVKIKDPNAEFNTPKEHGKLVEMKRLEKYPYAQYSNKYQQEFLESRIEKIRNAVKFMESNNFGPQYLLPLCYNTITIFKVNNYAQERIFIPIDGFENNFDKDPDKTEQENKKKIDYAKYYYIKLFKQSEKDCCSKVLFSFTGEVNAFDGNKSFTSDIRDYSDDQKTLSITEKRMVVQAMLSKDLKGVTSSALYFIETSGNNWDYGFDTEFTRTVICPYTLRPLVSNPITGSIESSGYTSQRLNTHQYFIDYINDIDQRNDEKPITDYLISREELVLYIYHKVVPYIKPTLPQGVLELVDMTLADYERVPAINKITVGQFKEVTKKSLHAFFTLEKENSFRKGIIFRMGSNIYNVFSELYEITKDNIELLDIIMLTSFDVIKVDAEMAEVHSNYLPVLYTENEISEYSVKDIVKLLNKPPMNLTEVKDRPELELFFELGFFDRKIVALSLISNGFLSPSTFFIPDYYQNKIENCISNFEVIESKFRQSSIVGNIYHETNPIIDYISIRKEIPTVDQLIGFYFNHNVPNKKLFVPITIRNVFQSALSGINKLVIDSNKNFSDRDFQSKLIVNFVCEQKAAATVESIESVYSNERGRLDNIRNYLYFKSKTLGKDSYRSNYGIKDISQFDKQQIDVQKTDKLVRSIKDKFPDMSQDYLRAFFKVIQTNNNGQIRYIPTFGYFSPTEQMIGINELKIKGRRGVANKTNTALHEFEHIIELLKKDQYWSRIIIISSVLLENCPLSDSIATARSSYMIPDNKYPLPNFDICPATLYPYMTDLRTWSELPIPPEEMYQDFPVFKYLFNHVLEYQSSGDTVEYPEFIPTVDQLLNEIYDGVLTDFKRRVTNEFTLFPPNAKEICYCVINLYKSVLINQLDKNIDRTQFLLRTTVCANMEKRIDFERRYMKTRGRNSTDVQGIEAKFKRTDYHGRMHTEFINYNEPKETKFNNPFLN